MNLESFSDEEVVLMSRALSIHRASLRRKLARLSTGSHEQTTCIDEMQLAGRIVNKLNRDDLRRIGVA